MGFWDAIKGAVKAGTKLLKDNWVSSNTEDKSTTTNIDQWQLANDNAIETNIDEANTLLEQQSSTWAWAVSDIPKQPKLESPIKNIVWTWEKQKQPEQLQTTEQLQEPKQEDGGFIDKALSSVWWFLTDSLDAIPWVIGSIDKWINNYLDAAISEDEYALQLDNKLNNIDWIVSPIKASNPFTSLWNWWVSWADQLNKDVSDYVYEQSKLDFDLDQYKNTHTPEEYVKYAEEVYGPKTLEARKEYLGKYSEDWNWPNEEQFSQMKEALWEYNQQLSDKAVELFPEQAKKMEETKNIVTSNLIYREYAWTIKSQWFSVTSNPTIIHNSAMLTTSINDTVYSVDNMIWLSDSEKKEYAENVINDYKVWVHILALKDSWASPEEIEKYAKEAWLEKRWFSFKKFREEVKHIKTTDALFSMPLSVTSAFIKSLWVEDRIEKTLEEADMKSLKRSAEHIDNIRDLQTYASREYWRWYWDNIAPFFDAMNLLKKWDLVNYWYYELDDTAKWSEYHRWNKAIDITKKSVEIWANVAAIMLTEWALTWIWWAASTAKWAAMIEWLTSVMVKSWMQDRMIEWALKANFPTMQIKDEDQQLNLVVWVFGAMIDWAVMFQKAAWIDKTFSRNLLKDKSHLAELAYWWDMTLKQKNAINQSYSAVEATIRVMNKTNPELTNLLVKDAVFKRQFYRYLDKVIMPKYQSLIDFYKWDVWKANEAFMTMFSDWISSQVERSDMVKNPAISVMDFISESSPVVNTAHDAPKVADITKGKPKLIWDSVEDVISYYLSDNAVKKTKESLWNILWIKTSDTMDDIVNKIKDVFKDDPKWSESVEKVITHKDYNGRYSFFDWWKQNDSLSTIMSVKWIDFNDEYKALANNSLTIAYKNMANNWTILVWEKYFDKIHYRKATDTEIENPDIPKFKIDVDKLVPVNSMWEDMIDWKKIWWGASSLQVAVDWFDTKDIDWISYVYNPIQLNKPVKSDAKYTRKIDLNDAQKTYIDYQKLINWDTKDIKFIDDNDLYIKTYNSIEWNTTFNRHAKTAMALDFLLEQHDKTKLLDVIEWLEWNELTRFVWYLNSNDPKWRLDYISTYEWPYKKAVKSLLDKENVWWSIKVKNHMANLLVEKWTFTDKATAYKYVNDNYDKLITYSVQNEKIKRDDILNLLWWRKAVLWLKANRDVLDPLAEFFYFNNFTPEIRDLINKISNEYKIVKTADLDDKTRWTISHTNKAILINWTLAWQSYAFAHEFWHWLDTMFTDETRKIISELYEKDRLKAAKKLMKEHKWMDLDWAYDLLNKKSTYIKWDKWRSNYYLWPDYYMVKNEAEWVAEQVARYLNWWIKKVPKEVRNILQKIFDWIKEIHQKLFWAKEYSAEFWKIMDNVKTYIDENIRNLPQEDLQKLIWNISFKDKEWNSLLETSKIFESPKTKITLAEELESKIIQYIDIEWGLSLPFLNDMENYVDMKSIPWTRKNTAAKKILHSYFDKYYNNKIRNIVDFSYTDMWWMDEAWSLLPKNVDVYHEFLLSKWKLQDLVKDAGYNRNALDKKINTIIKQNADAFNKNNKWIITREKIDESINSMIDDFNVYLAREWEKKWSVNPEKVNEVLSIVSDSDFNVKWEIFSFDFYSPDSWNKSLSNEIFNDAYKAKELILPLPWKVNVIKKSLKDFMESKDVWPIEWKIRFIVDSLPKDKKSYVIADYYTTRYWDYFTKNIPNLPDVTIIWSNMDMVSLRTEWKHLHIGSYNNNVFESLKNTINAVIDTKKWKYVDNTLAEVNNEAALSANMADYFEWLWLEELDDSIYKYKNRTPEYYINLINSRRATMDWYWNYQFIDMNVIKEDLSKRMIITPSKQPSLDDIFWWTEADEYILNKWFLETINEKYGLELKDKTNFSSEELDLISHLATRSYVSANHADMMYAQLKLLKKFMKQTPSNKEIYNANMTPLFHRNIMNAVDLNNIAIRWTVKNLFYEKLIWSWLPTATSSYILRLDEVADYLIDNNEEVEKMIENLLNWASSFWWLKQLDEKTLWSELSAYLDNYYKLNKNELVNYYNIKTGSDETLLKEWEEIDYDMSIEEWWQMFDRSTTAQKWLVLMFLNDMLQSVIEDKQTIYSATNFHVYDPLTKWRYLKDTWVERYVNWMWRADLDLITKQENFSKILNIWDKELNKYLWNTSKLLDLTKSEMKSYLDSTVEAWKKVAWKKYAPYFFNKEEIDNIFGEVYFQIKSYIKFLENNFWWTKKLNKIISDIKSKVYWLDKFSRVNNETLKLYTKFVNDTMDIIDQWHWEIMSELWTMAWSFDMDKLIKNWYTGKLTLWKDIKWNDVIITDSYSLDEFIKAEAKSLWYNLPEFKNASTSIKQLRLVGMYNDVIQWIIDSIALWQMDKAQMANYFYKNSRVENPFWWKGNLNVLDSENLTDRAKEFRWWDHMPSFDVYKLLSRNDWMTKDLANFFKNKWVTFKNPDEIVALDLVIKWNITNILEWYIRTKKYIWRDWNYDIKNIIVRSIFWWIKSTFTPSFYKWWVKAVSSKSPEFVSYVEKAMDNISMIKTARVNQKELRAAGILDVMRSTSVKYRTVADRLLDIMNSLWSYANNEAIEAIKNSNLWLNIKWHKVSLFDAIFSWDTRKKLSWLLRDEDEYLLQQQAMMNQEMLEEDFWWAQIAASAEDMISIEEKALDEIYWFDKKSWLDFAEDAKEKLENKPTLRWRIMWAYDYKAKEITKEWDVKVERFLDSVLNNKRWVNKYVTSEWFIVQTDSFMDWMYIPEQTQQYSEFMWTVWDDAPDLYHSVNHPKFDEDELAIEYWKWDLESVWPTLTPEEFKWIEDTYNEKTKWLNDLFTNCVDI